MRRHQQQSGPAATCPMMAACGVGCWVPSSTGWCRRRCRACARPRRGPGAVGGRSLWSAPAPAPGASCAALRRRSAVCGPGVLRPPIMPKRPCAFAPVRAARPSRCPLLALCGPGGFVARLVALWCPPGCRSPSRASRGSPGGSGGSWGLCGAVGASGGRGSLPLSPSALLRPRGGGPACLAVGGSAGWLPRCALFGPAPGALPLWAAVLLVGCANCQVWPGASLSCNGGLAAFPGYQGIGDGQGQAASRAAKRPLDNLQSPDAG